MADEIKGLSPFQLGEMGPFAMVPPETVALLKLPIGITPLYEASQALQAAYGKDIVIRTDAGLHGWIVMARPTEGEGSRDSQPNQ